MAVDGDKLVLVVLHVDDLLNGASVAAHHHEVLPLDSHEVIHCCAVMWLEGPLATASVVLLVREWTALQRI